ncbi:cytochrome c [Enhydrobacter sp.]|jgi:mono/diheme cytochrome c family protein|uniref:c-type cytochrome n=1 Tax=Enhydrobacter sp. TaxID=1894999 RepID=UPI0026143662|nr:cytochrome c [Enhydrobacter sp.]WIM12824.1 MAG: putative ABC-type Fe3+ transport system protein [Enhydrobacter sp.]
MNPGFAIVAILLAAVSSCDQMRHQPRYDSEERSVLFSDGKSLQAAPDGTIARDAPAQRQALRERPAMTEALLARGRERFGIYCTPCHDLSGHGQGIVPSRGFPHPPSFHIDRLRDAPSSYFVDVITNGHGVMYSYADRVSPADRWAIAAYIRALQLSQDAPASVLTDADRAKLDGGGR